MSSTIATDVLFDELLNNHENDLDLFLAMHYGFQDFYKKLCVEYFEKCLDRRLRQRIHKYNDEHKQKLELFSHPVRNSSATILAKYGGLMIASSAWPEKLNVFLNSLQGGCTYFIAGVCMDNSCGDLGDLAKPFEDHFMTFFKKCASYMLGEKNIECDYLNWNSLETFPAMAKDVLAARKNLDGAYPMTDYYVDLMMKLVEITDEVTKGSASC